LHPAAEFILSEVEMLRINSTGSSYFLLNVAYGMKEKISAGGVGYT